MKRREPALTEKSLNFGINPNWKNFLKNSDDQEFDARSGKKFSIESLSASVVFSIETATTQITLEVMEINEFESRDKSIMIGVLELSDNQDSDASNIL